jgi:hypothetical protein
MAKKAWVFELEDGTHRVDLEHSYFTGKRLVLVDGKAIVDVSPKIDKPTSILATFLYSIGLDFGSEYPIKIGSHEGKVIIRLRWGIYYTYHFILDGEEIQNA